MNLLRFTEMLKNNKIYIGILSFLIILVVAVNIFNIVNDNDSSDETDDVSVTGYGETANKEIFNVIVENLANTPCREFSDFNQPNYEIINNYSFNLAANLETQTDLPLYCRFVMGDEISVELKVITYNIDSVLDNSSQEKLDRVNGYLFSEIVDEGKIGLIDYAFGTDSVTGICEGAFYHPLNDFEYATIEYLEFGNECEGLIDVNKEFTQHFGGLISDKLESIYLEELEMSTIDLMKQLGL